MSSAKPQRRSLYADRLAEHGDFAFGDLDVFKHRGRWADFFRGRIGEGFDGRVVLEVGSANAELLVAMATKHPTQGFVGLDWKAKQTYEGAERTASAGAKNVALLRARAQDLSRIFAPGEIDEILVFHPEPCDRPEESRNRLLADPFLLDVHRSLRDERSTITLKTDHVGYYQWMLARLGAVENVGGDIRSGKTGSCDLHLPGEMPERSEIVCACFALANASSDFWNDAAVLRATARRVFAGETTMFERRFLKKRQPIYFLELRKRVP